MSIISYIIRNYFLSSYIFMYYYNKPTYTKIREVKMKVNLKKLIACLLIPIAVGVVSALLSSNSSEVYSSINKPPFAPPPATFSIVWPILYILMGVSLYLVVEHSTSDNQKAKKFFIVQLILNALWPLIFFGLENFLLAFFWIIALDIIVILMIVEFYKINKLSAYLQLPYLLWILFATLLNFSIYILN